jgi:hypothetical protein
MNIEMNIQYEMGVREPGGATNTSQAKQNSKANELIENWQYGIMYKQNTGLSFTYSYLIPTADTSKKTPFMAETKQPR